MSQDVNMLIRENPLLDNPPAAGDTFPLSAGLHRELLVNELMGKYYTMARRGKVYNFSTLVAGVAFPISTTVTPVFGLWNPAGSGVLMVPLMYSCSYVSGTAVMTGVGIAQLANTGNSVATAAPISSFTDQAPVGAMLNLGARGVVRGCSTATLTAAGAWYQSLGMNTFTGAATVPVNTTTFSTYDFQGSLLIPPGNLIYTVGNAASVALYQQTLYFAELPFGGGI